MTKNNTYLVFIISCIVCLITISSVFSDNQLPNSNFDEWIDHNNAEDWNTISFELFFFTLYSAEKTEDAAAGQYAVKLETQNVADEFFIPGYISLGGFDMDNMIPEGGIPFQDRPYSFGFSYKYTPVDEDFFTCFLILTKWNEETESRDTIGGSIFINNTLQQNYFHQVIPIAYQSEEAPDTINVGFTSSGVDPKAGSTLLVDSLVLGYTPVYPPTSALPATEIEYDKFQANWLPVYYANSYTLEVAKDIYFSDFLEHYESVVITNQFPESNKHIVNPETPGKYYYRIKVNYENEISEYSNTITVMMPNRAEQAHNLTHNSFYARWLIAENASRYKLEVSTDQQFNEVLEDYSNLHINPDENSKKVENLTPDKEYFYRVSVVYDEEEILLSNTVSVLTLEEPKHELCLISEPLEVGVLKGSGWFAANSERSISAETENDFTFLYWQNSITKEIIYENEYSFLMPEHDLCFTAFFESTATAISDNRKESEIAIYPNPAENHFTLEGTDYIHKIEIISSSGLIHTQAMPYSKSYTFSATKLKPGIHIVRVHTYKHIYHKKLKVIRP